MVTRKTHNKGAQTKANKPENALNPAPEFVDPNGLQQGLSHGQAAAIWPPQGWPMFSCITRASGTALSPTSSVTGKQTVCAYNVHLNGHNEYTLEVLFGTMHINGEINLNPALTIHFSGTEDWGGTTHPATAEPYPNLNLDQNTGSNTGPNTSSNTGANNILFEVYSYGRKLPSDRQIHLRAILAITYIISRIDRGLAPNIKKTLALYRLTPAE